MQIGSSSWNEIIQTGAASMAFDLDPRQIRQFALFAVELIKWNRKINLTTITDPQALAVRHFLDSIAPVALIPPGASLLDIGSGAGFPGIPLKIVRPDLRVTLIDSIRKKVSFQKHVIRTLGLENIWSQQIRAERYTPENQFDVVITRALSDLTEFAALALPLMEKDGLMLALKGQPVDARAEVSRLLTGETGRLPPNDHERLTATLSTYRLPGIETERTIVAVQKGARDSRA